MSAAELSLKFVPRSRRALGKHYGETPKMTVAVKRPLN